MTCSTTEVNGGAALRLASRDLELVVTTSFGPRISSLRGGRGKGENLLLEILAKDESLGEFILRGGHRLWHSPEDRRRTYQPDNDPLKVKKIPRGVELTQPVEPKTGLQKAIKIELLGHATVRLTHTLTNRGLWSVTCAPWALTMLRPGGYGVVPLPVRGNHASSLLPTYAMVPWSYTDFSLPVWDFHSEFIGIEVNLAKSAQKLGLAGHPGWSAYWSDGSVFVKHAQRKSGADYPDFGCDFETFTNGKMIELETLGVLAPIAPGKRARHVEHWTVLAGMAKPNTPAAFRQLQAKVQRWLKILC